MIAGELLILLMLFGLNMYTAYQIALVLKAAEASTSTNSITVEIHNTITISIQCAPISVNFIF